MTAFLICLYFIPTFFAFVRSHRNAAAIFVFNLILGWTVICWCAALVWSFTNESR